MTVYLRGLHAAPDSSTIPGQEPSPEQQAVDYALLRLYLKEQQHQHIDCLLRHPNNCQLPDCVPLLEEREDYQYLVYPPPAASCRWVAN